MLCVDVMCRCSVLVFHWHFVYFSLVRTLWISMVVDRDIRDITLQLHFRALCSIDILVVVGFGVCPNSMVRVVICGAWVWFYIKQPSNHVFDGIFEWNFFTFFFSKFFADVFRNVIPISWLNKMVFLFLF